MNSNDTMTAAMDAIEAQMTATQTNTPPVQIVGDDTPTVSKPEVQVNKPQVTVQPIQQPTPSATPSVQQDDIELNELIGAGYGDSVTPEEVASIEAATIPVSNSEALQQPTVTITDNQPVLPTPPTLAPPEDFVSETFAELEESLNEEPLTAEKSASINSILKSIKVDLNNIEIEEEMDPLRMSDLEDAILEDKTTMTVTCCQSSYSTEMTALKSHEIQNLANSDVTFYQYKRRLYQTIHKHMTNISAGPMSYGNWLHWTSFFDLDTLLYGIYCQTFNYENKYSISCPNPECGRSYDAIVNNVSLVELRGSEEETFAKINEIISTIHKPEDLIKHSHVHKTKRIILDESKIIIDVQIPSVYDYLENVVAKNDDSSLEEYQNSIGLALFIKNIMLPNVLLYNKTGQLKYVKLANSQDKIVTTVSNLSYYDSLQLTEEINNFIEKYRVTYSIRNVTCPHCGYIIKTIPLDMEDVLFNTIRRGRNV